MTRKILLAAACLFVLPGTALAADAQEAVSEGYNWSGFYGGIGVGAGGVVHELSSPLVPGLSFNGIGGEGFFGQVTVGYDYMLSERMLLGAFADGRFGNIGTSLEVPLVGLDASINATYGFDVGLRAGYLVTPTTLAYVLGGYSWQKFRLDANPFPFTYEWSGGGYMVGAGVEAAVAGNWTLRGEYRYARFAAHDIVEGLGGPAGILDVTPSTHTFLVGLNYRPGARNGGGASFAAPAYNWSGFYVGGAFGAGAASHELASNLIPGGITFNGIGAEGVFGELSVGYDRDFGNFVGGVLVDGRYSGITTSLNVGILPISANVDADYGFDVLARVGAKLDEATLAYVLGGYSWQHFDVNFTTPGPSGSLYDWGSHGFSVGGGLEAAVSEHMTVGIEYRYSQYAKKDFLEEFGAPPGLLTDTPSFHTARLGAKYKFN
ncbi:MAG: porin family protein [Rhizobiaceae bacterium]|nr:MAG: porin family protein [Rhizobiaceae bacterium]CAG1002918.1 hypothetical protein RHIZO_02975 [Rhizobiaceae bacterium]